MRMVWGYRHHLPGAGYPDTIPLSRRPRSKSTLPRRSFELYDDGTGIILVPDTGTQITDMSVLDTGDLVFFDASDDDKTRLDHVGMYLGTDTAGSHRFISSRKTADGPTLGDKGGDSVLDGAGLFARAFRAARRL
jgi:cell wall-associated NlpC family hydrolase